MGFTGTLNQTSSAGRANRGTLGRTAVRGRSATRKGGGEAVYSVRPSTLPRNLLHGKRLDDIALFDVVELLHGQAALVVLSDLPGVVLEPLQGLLVGVDLGEPELAAQGISLQVTDLHTIKPLDAEAVTEAARRCGAVVTAEEHQVAGGLFGAVSELLARTCPVPMEAVAVQDTFGESGPPAALMARYGLDAAAIVRAVLACLARKG